jgi:glycosyltransferase involved in cell wall biosynthesis
LLKNYSAIVTLSEHMRTEYIKHGLDPARVYNISKIRNASASSSCNAAEATFYCGSSTLQSDRDNRRQSGWRLLFLGRMDFLKGGRTLLEALPKIRKVLGPLHLACAGDGPDRGVWERLALKLQEKDPGLSITFPGWMTADRLELLFADSDILVLPSLWPEPFGLVGIEAGLRGLPTVAFDVGGVREWLRDGVNGTLASGNPPSVAGLVDAIIKCLSDRHEYARLASGAFTVATRISLENYAKATLMVFEEVLNRRHAGQISRPQ